MISKMTKYSFILLSGDKDSFIEKLGALGLVDIVRSSKPVDDASHGMMAEIEQLGSLIQGLQNADVPEGTVPEPISKDIVSQASEVLQQYSEDRNAIRELEKEVESLHVWGNFDRTILD